MSLTLTEDTDALPPRKKAAELLQEIIQQFDALPDGTEVKANWLQSRPRAVKALARLFCA